MAEKNVEVVLKEVLIAFAAVHRPKRGNDEDSEPKYQGTFLIPKKTKEGKALREAILDAIDEVKEAQWGDEPPKLKADKLCLRDGDDESYDGFEDHWYLKANNSNQPALADRYGEVPDRDIIQSGAVVNAWVRIWAQDNKHGKRVNASLEAVQYVKKGDVDWSGRKEFEREKFSTYEADEAEDPRSRGKKSSRRDDDDYDDDRDSRKSSKRSRSRDDDEDDDRRETRRSGARRRSRDEDDEV